MSFLTPLYLAGLAAVSLPILFHLIRRTPKNQMTFSSLLFLAPSPPRITRRSRIENWLLLLLRIAALALIALAFARPFFRDQVEAAVTQSESRRIAIVVDTSASMTREGLWEAALEAVEAEIAELTLSDSVALYSFADGVQTHVGFMRGTEDAKADSIELVEEALPELEPQWGHTNVGEALVQVADTLHTLDAEVGPVEERQLILVSDLQEGAELEALRAYDWPDGVQLKVRSVSPTIRGNAGIELLSVEPQLTEESKAIRLRLTNSSESAVDEYKLQWFDEDGEEIGEPQLAYAPAGESRVVRLAWPNTSMTRGYIELIGDDIQFDNRCYVARVIPPVRVVGFVGNSNIADSNNLAYYLDRAFQPDESHSEKWQFQPVDAADPGPLPSPRRSLLVTTSLIPERTARSLESWVKEGGRLCFVLTDAETDSLNIISGSNFDGIEEGSVRDYQMLGQIDFTHPVFEPFAEPRFSDFTPIRFQKYRQVELNDDRWTVLARYDNADIALIEKRIGDGAVFVLTSSWARTESRLALSTKFVPLLISMADSHRPVSRTDQNHIRIGERLAPEGRELTAAPKPLVQSSKLAVEDEAARSPGLYEIEFDEQPSTVAVNIENGESRIKKLPETVWEQMGIESVSDQEQMAETERTRQLQRQELESSQKYWRYLLIAAIAILIIESALAGRQTRNSFTGDTSDGSEVTATT